MKRDLSAGATQSEAGRAVGRNQGSVSAIMLGKAWGHCTGIQKRGT